MLDTRLQTFIIVTERKSFSLAAQELYMTQSAVSQHIHALEAYYGVKLFDRLPRRILVTPAGEQLYHYAKKIKRQSLAAEKAILDMANLVRGRLHIGASLTVGEYLLPGILVAFNRLYPDVDITMDVFNSEQVKTLVLEGQLDAGFIEGPAEMPDCLHCTSWGGDELIIIAPANYEVAKQPISLGDLLTERWILREPSSGTRNSFEAFLSSQGLDPSALNTRMQLGSTQAIKEAVKAGLGLSTVSNLAVAEDIARGEYKVLQLEEGSIKREFTCIYHRDKFRTHSTEKFLSFIAQ